MTRAATAVPLAGLDIPCVATGIRTAPDARTGAIAEQRCTLRAGHEEDGWNHRWAWHDVEEAF